MESYCQAGENRIWTAVSSWMAAVYRASCADGVMLTANKAVPNMPQSENERTDITFYVKYVLRLTDCRSTVPLPGSLLPLSPFSTVKNAKDGQLYIYLKKTSSG